MPVFFLFYLWYSTGYMDLKNTKKIAIVHDFLLYPGGAEKVLEVMAEMYPEAPIYTLLYDKEGMRGMFAKRDIRASFLQSFPKFLRCRHRWLLPFYASAVEAFDLREYDLVISSSGAWSKGIVTKLKTKHLAYLHSPMRYVWDYNERYARALGKKLGICARLFLSYARLWDAQVADRPDALVANSSYTKDRVAKYYRRDSTVVYPPVSLGERYKMEDVADETLQKKKYFLLVSRLTASKRVDIAIESFNKMRLPLVIIGEGSESARYGKMAGRNIRFLGWQKPEALSRYYANARAVIFPSEDDFGIVPVEAMQMGTPVIALGRGGAIETIVEGKTGEFFGAPIAASLSDAVRRFIEKETTYDRSEIRERGMQFSKEKFKEAFQAQLDSMG